MVEKRRHHRKRLDQAIEFQVGDGPRHPGVCRDLSLGGMHIEAESVPPFGASIVIHVRLKGQPATSALPAVVRWLKPGSIGVQFGLLGARDTYALSEMLAAP